MDISRIHYLHLRAHDSCPHPNARCLASEGIHLKGISLPCVGHPAPSLSMDSRQSPLVLQTSSSLVFAVSKAREHQYVDSREQNIDLRSRQHQQPTSINLMLYVFHCNCHHYYCQP